MTRQKNDIGTVRASWWKKAVRAAVAAAAVAVAVPSDGADKPDKPAGSPNAVIPGESPNDAAIGSVRLGSVNLPLYADARNPGRPPEQTQFRYAPAFVPQTKDKKIVSTGPTLLPSGKYEVAVNVLLSSPGLDYLAHEEVKRRVPEHAAKIHEQNVYVWPVQWVRATVPEDVQAKFPTLRLGKSSWNLDANKAVTVRCWLDTEADAKAFAADLASFALEVQYARTAAATTRHGIEVTAGQIRTSELYAKLNGLGTDAVYVRRSDLRRLCQSVRDGLDYRESIEDPDRFDTSLGGRAAEQAQAKLLTVKVDKFDEEVAKSTYHGADLSPTVLTKTLEKLFIYDEATQHFKLNTSLDTAAEASVLGLFGGKGSLKATYSKDELVHVLRQYDIHVALEGHIVRPKAVDVLRLSVGRLDAEYTLRWETLLVHTPTQVERRGLIQFGTMAQEAGALIERVEEQRLANKADGAAKFAATAKGQAEAQEARVKGWEERSLTVEGLQARAAGGKQLTEAATATDAGDQLRTQGLHAAALKQYEEAGQKYIAAKQALAQVQQKPKGVITKIEVSTNIGDDDCEKNAYLIVHIGAQAVPLGVNRHWGSRQAGPSAVLDNLQIDITSAIEVKAGLQNHGNERNVIADAAFTITLHMRDAAGNTAVLPVSIPQQRYSTDGKGLGASDVKTTRTVQRFDFK